MREKPLVSVVMNYLYNPDLLYETLTSVYDQTFENWEVVLWDNGSEEDIAPIRSSLDYRLKWHRTEDTVSLGEARNRALEAVHGDFVAFLDADDIWDPTKLEQQLLVFKDPEVGVAYTGVERFWPDGYIRDKYAGTPQPSGHVTEKLMLNNFVVFSTVMFRANALAGGAMRFDPSLTALEDTDWLVRMSGEWRFAFLPEILCRYRQHNRSFSATQTQIFRKEERDLVKRYERDFPEVWAKVGPVVTRTIECNEAVHRWKSGDGAGARRHLRNTGIRSWRAVKVYLASLIPYRQLSRVLAFLGQGPSINAAHDK